MNTIVYRCYDQAGALLYVGMTRSYRRRMYGHATSSRWFKLVDHIATEEFATVVEASERERELIRDLNPRHNGVRYLKGPHQKHQKRRNDRQYQHKFTPELRERFDAYVAAENERIAPAKLALRSVINAALREYLDKRCATTESEAA